jgi:hypothetical protein
LNLQNEIDIRETKLKIESELNKIHLYNQTA